MVFLVLFCGVVCRLLTAPRDTWADFRRFFQFHTIRVGMQSAVTAPFVLGGGLLLVGLLLSILGWWMELPIVTAIGVMQFTILFRLLMWYLAIVVACTIARDVVRPLRRKSSHATDRFRGNRVPEFVQDRLEDKPEYLKPGGCYQVLNIRRYGNMR